MLSSMLTMLRAFLVVVDIDNVAVNVVVNVENVVVQCTQVGFGQP